MDAFSFLSIIVATCNRNNNKKNNDAIDRFTYMVITRF